MIVGSIYLGNKARKAYRNRKAEKAAQRLTAPYDVADPSDELKIQVPPTSPSASTTSLQTTPTSLKFPEATRLKSSSSSTDLRTGPSASSSLSRPRSGTGPPDEREYERFVQRQSTDVFNDSEDAPPSYDAVVASPPPSQPPSGVSYSPHNSIHSSGPSPQSAYPTWSSTHSHHNHCPECFALMQQQMQQQMQQMHMHGHHHHHSMVSPISGSQPPVQLHGTPVPRTQSPQPMTPQVAEMADPSALHRLQHSSASNPVVEAPDTGTYSATSGPIFEMPAELPADFETRSASKPATKQEDDGSEGEDDNFRRDLAKRVEAGVTD